MKHKILKTAAIAAIFFAVPTLVSAQTANHTVNVNVQAINVMSVGAGPTIQISTATAGSQPDANTGASTYAITTNGSAKKITAGTDVAMPTGLTLSLNMTAPTGGTSAGAVSLGTSAADMVTGISKKAESGIAMSYSAAATVAAVVQNNAFVVTFTITN